LTGRKKKAIRERLAEDASLREEEQALRLIREATRSLPKDCVSDDFNSRLLNRIATERFAETRSKAMLPRRSVPLPLFARLAPVVVTAAVVLVVGAFWMYPNGENVPYSADSRLDDTYLTAQPQNNPNMTVAVSQDWSLEKALQQSRRVTRIFNQLTSGQGFVPAHRQGDARRVSVRQPVNSPYVSHYFQVVPVQTVYQVNNVRRTGSTY
jgi:negative regulator of sigma E activity